jgi:uncharacterized membrane protein YdcZ (DUF606 family)
VIVCFLLPLQQQLQRPLQNLQHVLGLFLHRSPQFKHWLSLAAAAAVVHTDVVMTPALAAAVELSLLLVSQLLQGNQSQ